MSRARPRVVGDEAKAENRTLSGAIASQLIVSKPGLPALEGQRAPFRVARGTEQCQPSPRLSRVSGAASWLQPTTRIGTRTRQECVSGVRDAEIMGRMNPAGGGGGVEGGMH